jgi:hypothetical protein
VGDILATLQFPAWALSVTIQVCLLGILLYRRSYLRFPWFATYIAAVILQAVTLYIAYQHYGFVAQAVSSSAWSVQSFVTFLRMMAVIEVCRHIFAGYWGIWALIWRTVTISVLLVAAAAMAFGNHDFSLRVLHADRAVGLALSAGIVGIFVFGRYFHVQSREPMRSMALGFFFFSCFVVLNDTVLETWPRLGYPSLWNLLGLVSFVVSLLLWSNALRRTYPALTFAPVLLPANVYQAMSPEINVRLAHLNERLSHLGKRPVLRP